MLIYTLLTVESIEICLYRNEIYHIERNKPMNNDR